MLSAFGPPRLGSTAMTTADYSPFKVYDGTVTGATANAVAAEYPLAVATAELGYTRHAAGQEELGCIHI